jgi:tetratricopeptide (TPR) repeat protein
LDDLPDRLTAPTLPDEVAAIRNEARALGALGDEKAAEAVLTAGMQRFPRHPGLIQDHAEIAERRGDTKAALHRWETMRRRMPGQPQASLGAARAFRDAGRLQDAVRVMDEAAARFPANFFVLTACADLAMEQRDWRRAAELTEVLRARFPHHPRGYVDGGTALRHLHRTDEADRVTEAGLARYRGHLQLLVNHARTAMQRPDWAQAERRWRDVQASHPKAAVGYIGLAEMFRLRAQHAAGEDVLRTGLKVLPGHPALLAQFAVSATQRGAWAEAAERWRGYALRFPQKGVGHHQLGLALKQLGLAEAADRALAAGTELAPDHLALALEWALCAQAANDCAEAVRRWQTLDVRFPGTLEVQEGLLQARLGAAECGIAVPDDAAWPAPGQAGPSDEASTPEEILSQFEGLGENCEFGLVQRHYGLEPISLLRWVSISIAGLIHSLEDGLQDVGNPAHTSLVVHPPAEEYFVRDSFYRFGMHTFVKKGSMPEQRFYEQQCRRLRFLGRKLREDLELGERIFVHFRKEETSAAQLQKLHAAVRRHGTATLLFVRLCDAAHKPGTVEVADTGLLIGYIDRFGKIPPVGWNIAFDTWLEICRKALDLKRKLAAIGPALP